MKYAHILSAFYAHPWAILPSKLEEVRAFLHLKAAGGDVDPEEIRAIVAARRQTIGAELVGRTALVSVFGMLAQRVGGLEAASGGVGTEAIGATLDRLVADREVRSIVLVVDSPGGSVFGVQELADKIRAYRAEKKIIGIADSVAASAAYWLLAQTSEVNVTPGGQVGSVGVVAAHQDTSKAQEIAGVKTTYVSSSPHKTDGVPESPLTPEALAELQSKVNHYHSLFVAGLAKGRGVSESRVEKDFGGGRMLTPKEALAAGMVDRVATLEQVLARLGAPAGGPSAEAQGPPLSARLAAVRARAVTVDG